MYIKKPLLGTGGEIILDKEEALKLRFSRLNIIVGANNSGKSRLIRSLFKEYTWSDNKKNEVYGELRRKFALVFTSMKEKVHNRVKLYEELYKILGLNSEMADFEMHTRKELSNYEQYLELFLSCKKLKAKLNNEISSDQMEDEYVGGFVQAVDDCVNSMELLFALIYCDGRYIPINRTLRPLKKIADNSRSTLSEWEHDEVVRDRIFDEYFLKEDHLRERIITGQSVYSLIEDKKNSDINSRNQIMDYENFLGQSFFNGEKITLTPRKKDKTLLFMTGKTYEYEIYKWGDSLQSIISLTLDAYLNREKRMVYFIEEPEIHLHPSMQRKIIEVLLSETFKMHQFFFTTHSNHILDLSMDYKDVSVFLLNKRERAVHLSLVGDSDENPFDVLGVRNSSVMLANCTIWVEGISDVIYYRYYLRRYFENNNIKWITEDYHYSFIEYGGSCIEHWKLYLGAVPEGIDYKAITRKVFLLADHPNDKNGMNKLDEIKIMLEGRCHILKVMEVENLLPYQALNLYLEKNNVTNRIDEEEDYKDVKIGDLLCKKGAPVSLVDASRNIRDKYRFALKMTEQMQNIQYEDLTDEAKSVAKEICDFIVLMNS